MRVFDAWRSWADAEPALRDRLGPHVVDHLRTAFDYAASCHGDQTRPAGEPYVEHLLQALQIAIEVGNTTDQDILTATLLHDVVEDTNCTIDDIKQRFGDKTADLVAWVTKTGDKQHYLASFDQAPHDVLIVKLSDRYSNVQRLDTHPRPEKQASYYAETVRWFVPLTERAPRFAPYFAEWRQRFADLERTADA